MKKKQIGFTLIELMISLALGLIVVAASILLFLTGQKGVAMQKGVSELQDNANFGLNYITRTYALLFIDFLWQQMILIENKFINKVLDNWFK